MFSVTDACGTSNPVAAFTSFTPCDAELPAMQIRPREFTLNAVAPTVKFIPTQPV